MMQDLTEGTHDKIKYIKNERNNKDFNSKT